MLHFDSTVSMGSILTLIGLIVAILSFRKAQKAATEARIAAERDMDWRVKNLETWRKEHMVDADARDALLRTMGRVLDHVQWQTAYMQGKRTDPPPMDPPR
jgi:hypothetical protein